ncbi:hypothetical protein NEUTE1DRAFT_45708, partial [Neurospora tetrasperma FGSC 2508]
PDQTGPNTPSCTGRNFRNPTSSVPRKAPQKPERTGCIPMHPSPHLPSTGFLTPSISCHAM